MRYERIFEHVVEARIHLARASEGLKEHGQHGEILSRNVEHAAELLRNVRNTLDNWRDEDKT